jgi:hypothetical protein
MFKVLESYQACISRKLAYFMFIEQKFSVADPGCLSRIPDPDFYPSRIPDPGFRIPDPGSKNSNKRER